VIASGALLDVRLLATAGVVMYLVGLVVIGIPLAHSLQWRTQYRYGPASVLAAVLWLVSCVTALGVILAASDGWEQAADRAVLLALLPAGSALQMVAAVATVAAFATFLVLAVRAIATARRRAR
jgi:hypothetical protein